MRLENKVALITGGAAGIGEATVLRFAEEGAKVAFCDVNEEQGSALLHEIGSAHDFQKVDVTDRKKVQEWVDHVAQKYGQIDICVNNAGILRDGVFVKVKDGKLVKQMTEEAFDSVVAVNLKGVFNCHPALRSRMHANWRGDFECILDRRAGWQFRANQLNCYKSWGGWHDQGMGS